MGCQISSRHLPGAIPDPQSKRGIIFNIHTGYVSPQFHVKFDETFRTVLQEKWNAQYRLYKTDQQGIPR